LSWALKEHELMTESIAPKARETLSERTARAAREVLAGERKDLRAYLSFFGPAVVASIAYMDPGNFATNIQAGAKYGYELLWVVLLANLIAILFQALSAKLGIVTGCNLAEMCRDQFPKMVVYMMWRSSSAERSDFRCCLASRSFMGWSSPDSLSTAS
jgi:manganese transport protein